MPEESDADDGGHLDEVPDGCGCVEIWEHLSEERREGTGENEDDV